MMKRLILIGLLMIAAVVLAQDDTSESTETPEATPEATVDADMCPILVNNALDLTEESCDGTSTNQACYGYIFIDSELRNPDVPFSQSGDRVNVSDIASLQLSPLDTNTGQWGLLTMLVEPNIDSAASVEDDVQLILYGDTTIENAYEFVQVTALSDLNVHQLPTTDSGILGELATGESIITNSRLDDDLWLRVRYTDVNGNATLGWIQTERVNPAQAIDVLPALSFADALNPPDDLAATYGPMQAIIFQSSDEANLCDEAPTNGMLIQTPEGVASVNIWLDEVVIQLDGTGVVTAQADGELSVGVISGSAQVTSENETRTIITGQAVDVTLGSDGLAESAPSPPRPLGADEVNALPVVLLDDDVTIPDVSAVDTSTPIDGEWLFNYDVPPPFICSDGSEIQSVSAGLPATITVQADSIIFSGLPFDETSNGIYTASYLDAQGNLIQDTLQITTSDRITGERVIDFVQPPCTLTVTFTLQLTRPSN